MGLGESPWKRGWYIIPDFKILEEDKPQPQISYDKRSLIHVFDLAAKDCLYRSLFCCHVFDLAAKNCLYCSGFCCMNSSTSSIVGSMMIKNEISRSIPPVVYI